jgi:uncharacterized membrane protein
MEMTPAHSGNPATELIRYAENGTLSAPALAVALRLAGVTPDVAAWRRFFDRLLIISGALLAGAGVIFFVAYNWQSLGRYARFGMLEALILAATLYALVVGLGALRAQAALLFAVLVQGGLLALLGQTYQTGADNYELFLAWALMALPWVLAARWAPQWGLWWTLINLALALYLFQVLDPVRLLFFGRMRPGALVLLNLAGLAAFEWAGMRYAQLRTRWLPRYCGLLALAAGTFAALLYLIEGAREDNGAGCVIYFLMIAGGAWFYQYRRHDLFPLAFGALSLIIVVTGWMTRHLFSANGVFGGLTMMAAVVLGASIGATLWLRDLNRKWDAQAALVPEAPAL